MATVSLGLILLLICHLTTIAATRRDRLLSSADRIVRLADRSDLSDETADEESYDGNHRSTLVIRQKFPTSFYLETSLNYVGTGHVTDDVDSGRLPRSSFSGEQGQEQPVVIATPVSSGSGNGGLSERDSPFLVHHRTAANLRRAGSGSSGRDGAADRATSDAINSGLRERSAVVHGPMTRRGSGAGGRGEVSVSQLVQLLNSFQTGRSGHDGDGLPPLQSLRFG